MCGDSGLNDIQLVMSGIRDKFLHFLSQTMGVNAFFHIVRIDLTDPAQMCDRHLRGSLRRWSIPTATLLCTLLRSPLPLLQPAQLWFPTLRRFKTACNVFIWRRVMASAAWLPSCFGVVSVIGRAHESAPARLFRDCR